MTNRTMLKIEKITPHLWFDNQAEEAARFYTAVFMDSGIDAINHYTKAGRDVHKREPGSVMTVEFHLEGQNFIALNGGPIFTFNESVSFMVNCDSQDEIDYYWNKLSEGGNPQAQQCGWLKDKFGLSWQITPRELPELLTNADEEKAERVMEAMLRMKKLNIEELRKAADSPEVAVV
ncbi:MAG TPA: VOC family protein [Ohtaekwangia sp.]